MSKSQSAYAMIRERILEGSYTPGQRLVLSTLAVELGISAVPVREAIRLLEAEGWVTFTPNVGAEVRAVDAVDWVHVMETLALAEGLATALAAEVITPAELELARMENEKIRHAVDVFDPVAATRSSRNFHRILCAPCPNHYLLGVMERTSEKIETMRSTVFDTIPNRTLESTREHEILISLIQSRAARSTIEAYAREHKLRTITAFIAADECPAEQRLAERGALHN